MYSVTVRSKLFFSRDKCIDIEVVYTLLNWSTRCSLPPVVQAEFEEEEYQVHEDAGSVEVCVALTTETAKDVVVRIVGSKNNISELVFEGREGENDSTFSHIHVQ